MFSYTLVTVNTQPNYPFFAGNTCFGIECAVHLFDSIEDYKYHC